MGSDCLMAPAPQLARVTSTAPLVLHLFPEINYGANGESKITIRFRQRLIESPSSLLPKAGRKAMPSQTATKSRYSFRVISCPGNQSSLYLALLASSVSIFSSLPLQGDSSRDKILAKTETGNTEEELSERARHRRGDAF